MKSGGQNAFEVVKKIYNLLLIPQKKTGFFPRECSIFFMARIVEPVVTKSSNTITFFSTGTM